MNKIRIEVMSKKEIAIYKIIRDNFDLAVDFAREHLGYYISNGKAKKCLKTYFLSQCWTYPYSTVNNIPFMLFNFEPMINPDGLLIKKGSSLERTIRKTSDLKMEHISGLDYNKLLPNSRDGMPLAIILWNHQLDKTESSGLKESICIEISKDVSQNSMRPEWKTLINKKIKIPNDGFIKFINAKTVYRDKALQDFAHKLMPPI
jgi:hypothetical protein